MSSLINNLTGKNKVEFSPIDLDSEVERVVSEYVGTYLRNRIFLAAQSKIPVNEDPGYLQIVNFLALVNMEFNHMRMWSTSDMTNTVWPQIVEDEYVLRFVFKGTTHVSVRCFDGDVPFQKLVDHVAGSLSCMSHGGNEIIAAALTQVLPRNDELVELFTGNQWSLFIYYLTRINIIEIVTNSGGSV
ncbi:hypothetical protein RAY_155 [Erwinia phage vB_EamM_RAY]|jgi:hypothetical protein|uniref:Uncharacterized protein n=9 Tax=Agricanvirus TaxID=1984776 RepID=A0A173GE56_9CAUD|nr:hypothetical protein FDH97_gp160 [Erwinia phage vB_EamM_Deimos-Minion]YP_009605622.1 hypothetical protein FDH98_gp155 [Erwinia phage vB_EamM_RAY]YP_009605942.1 hypothetical protein FDH99_gp158 [Erwinia phage vB_EamM_Simmy50]YP_009606263.1 hypothetical protein FDI00_gp157 [Erwinia phage vB_EamM_Special G]YP_009621896.1 hypothetical protein FDJ23_gp155 [Erwinia phage vB_EamM_Desertfox]AUG85943.1 hypothetical protein BOSOLAPHORUS_156 [Erwinia phage vB_EamM_Bosolaphorus]AUG86584.1 hypothetical